MVYALSSNEHICAGAGVHVACGNASKVFHPFLLPGDMKGNSEALRNKLLVNFDPLRCYVGDLEASFM